MMSILWFGQTAVMGGLVVAVPTVWAQQKTPFPPFTGERVIVEGVPDRFDDARPDRAVGEVIAAIVLRRRRQVDRARRIGHGEYIDELRDAWLGQKARNGRSFDPDRSVLIVVDLENHQVALLPGVALRKQFGLQPAVVKRELIPVFVDLAQDREYPKAITALLNKTNDWIAARDTSTKFAQDELRTPASRATKGSDRRLETRRS